jgi:hypothetical protein
VPKSPQSSQVIDMLRMIRKPFGIIGRMAGVLSPIWLSMVPSLTLCALCPTRYHPLMLKRSPRNQGRSMVAMKNSNVTEASLE